MSTRNTPPVPSLRSPRKANAPPSFMDAFATLRNVPPTGVASPTSTTRCSRSPPERNRPSRAARDAGAEPDSPVAGDADQAEGREHAPGRGASGARDRGAHARMSRKSPVLPSSRIAVNATCPCAP